MNPLVIQTESPGAWYAFVYAAAFIVGFVLLAWEGRRRRLPTLAWWLILASTFLFFVIGTQVLRWNAADWSHVLRYEALERWPGRTVLGGMLLFVPALCLVKYTLRFTQSVVDGFAMVFPVGLAIQRVGCFITGCCFGTPTSLPWGVHYGPQSEAFHFHVSSGLVDPASSLSAAVHPVQLYDLACCLLMVGVLYRLRPHLKAPGNLLALSLALYGAFRFFLEFVRSPRTPWDFAITPAQVALLVLLPFAAMWIWRRERVFQPASANRAEPLSLVHLGAYAGVFMLVFVFFSKWMSGLEVACVVLVTLPAVLLLSWRVYTAFTVPALRLTTALLVGLSMVLMSQAVPEEAVDPNKRLRYWTVGYGYTSGIYDITKEAEAGCGSGPLFKQTYENSYKAHGVSLGFTDQLGEESSVVYRLGGFVGSQKETVSSTSGLPKLETSYTNWGISPYIERNWRKVGLGVGITMGSFTRNFGVKAGDSSAMQVLSFVPAFHVRFGVFKKGFIEYRVASQFPTPFPAQANQIALGFGFGQGGSFRVGTSSYSTFFIEPAIPIGQHLLIQPWISLGGGFSNGNEAQANQYAIAVHYKFGRTER